MHNVAGLRDIYLVCRSGLLLIIAISSLLTLGDLERYWAEKLHSTDLPEIPATVLVQVL